MRDVIQRDQPAASQASITAAVVFYCICSGSMLIVNKLAVVHLPVPALLTVCQFTSASTFVYTCKLLGILEMVRQRGPSHPCGHPPNQRHNCLLRAALWTRKERPRRSGAEARARRRSCACPQVADASTLTPQDDFEWSKVKYFVLYVLAFSLGTWTNMKVLQTANVETVIVFRSCCPIVVAGFDYIFYGRACPSLRSVASLLLITGGAVGYILNDKEFQNSGWVAYYWVMIWWTVLIFQLTYGKFLVSGLALKSLWTPVLYTNTLSVLPAMLVGMMAGELSQAPNPNPNPNPKPDPDPNPNPEPQAQPQPQPEPQPQP